MNEIGVTAAEGCRRLNEAFGNFSRVLGETTISFAQLGIELLKYKRRQRWYNKLFNRKGDNI